MGHERGWPPPRAGMVPLWRTRALGRMQEGKHVARGRGAGLWVSTSATASRNSAPRGHKGRWEFGEHDETFGRCEPNTLLPPPPGPVAARADCRIQQGRKNQILSENIRPKGRGRSGERPASATATTILHKYKMQANWTCPNNNVIALSAPSRHTHTQSAFAPRTPRAPRCMERFSTSGVDGRGWPHG